MFIKISNLRDGDYLYSFNEPIDEIELETPFYGNFQADVKLSKVHNQIVLEASITAQTIFDCDRCTTSFESQIKTSYRMVYMFSSNGEEPESLNITYLPLVADKVELSKDFRDYLILAVPMKKLCKEECKGLCPNCGQDLNVMECSCEKNKIDVKWMPLMELKNKLNSN